MSRPYLLSVWWCPFVCLLIVFITKMTQGDAFFVSVNHNYFFLRFTEEHYGVSNVYEMDTMIIRLKEKETLSHFYIILSKQA